MSALSDKVAREHVLYRCTEDTDEVVWGARVPRFVGYECECGWTTKNAMDTSMHLAEVTEAAVREASAADIEKLVIALAMANGQTEDYIRNRFGILPPERTP